MTGRRHKGKLILSVTIHDCDVQTFPAGGPGGQHANKSYTGVRVIHRPSGARAESREQRSQLQNKRAAFKRMTETQKFKTWLARELWLKHGTGPAPEDKVRNDMVPDNLLIERCIHGRWEAWE